MPLPLAALMLAGTAAAAMSTVDSLSLVLSSIAVHDLYERVFETKLNEAQKTTRARIVAAFFPAIATLIALNPPTLIVGFVINTSYAAFSALAPAVIFGFYWSRATTQGARWSLSIGLATALLIIGFWPNPFGLNVNNDERAEVAAIVLQHEALRADHLGEVQRRAWGHQVVVHIHDDQKVRLDRGRCRRDVPAKFPRDVVVDHGSELSRYVLAATLSQTANALDALPGQWSDDWGRNARTES